MDGFKRGPRPNRPVAPTQPTRPVVQKLPTASTPTPRPPEPPRQHEVPDISIADLSTTPHRPITTRKIWSKKLMMIVLPLVGLFLCIAAVCTWYLLGTQPRDKGDTSVVKFEVKESASFAAIADDLEARGVIRNALAFVVYARLHGQQDNIKAGTCNLSPSESVGEVLDRLTAGCHDFKVITFYPGATIDTSLYAQTHAAETNQLFKDVSVRQTLVAAGYTQAQVDDALTATYSGPLFAGKPAGVGYEGYVFGETYYVSENATAKEVLQTAFDHMYEVIKQDDLVAKFTDQGLTLYQGITLASIVEKELDCEGKPTEERKQRCYGYQQHIASVFYNRLKRDMSLGSDVTFIYAADRLGVAPSVSVDSPYNTRIHAGLTPGPIASPGELALMAVGNPTASNDLYFLAGDDGLIYFAQDEAGHQANIKNHCQENCGNPV